jgi:hypothetical protein
MDKSSELGKPHIGYLQLSHAFDDIPEVGYVMACLRTINQLWVRKNSASKFVTEDTKPKRILNAQELPGQMNLLSLLFKEEYQWLLTYFWLMDQDVKYNRLDKCFPPETVEYLRELFNAPSNRITPTRLINHLRVRNPLNVTGDWDFPMSVDIIEVIKNVSRYAHTYVTSEIKGRDVIITNDIKGYQLPESKGSGRGNELHTLNAFFDRENQTYTTTIKGVIADDVITYQDLCGLAKNCGWSKVPEINGSGNPGGLIQEFMNATGQDTIVFYFETLQNKTAFLSHMGKLFSTHVDFEMIIHITEDLYFDERYNVSFGFEFHSCMEYHIEKG